MKIKKLIGFLIFIICTSLCVIFHTDISNYILENFVINKKIIISEANIYYKNYDYIYVQTTDNFEPKNKQELINIFYTILNSGWTQFEFYCDNDYETCYNDIEYITKESDIISSINNLVSPYNSYKYLSFEISSFGKISVTIDKLYSDEEINYVNNKINEIMNDVIKDNMTTKEKILVFHDYIADLIEYDDVSKIEENASNKASGALINKKAVCSGYSDLMAIFLDKLGINNYKIINEDHVWNLIYLNDSWLHIDLTWDDPKTTNNKPVIIHDFFLITTSELNSISTKLKNQQHDFDTNIYVEAK